MRRGRALKALFHARKLSSSPTGSLIGRETSRLTANYPAVVRPSVAGRAARRFSAIFGLFPPHSLFPLLLHLPC